MALYTNTSKRCLVSKPAGPNADGPRVRILPTHEADIDPSLFARAIERGDLVPSSGAAKSDDDADAKSGRKAKKD